MAKDLNNAMANAMTSLSLSRVPIAFDKYELRQAVEAVDEWLDNPRKEHGIGTDKWSSRHLDDLTERIRIATDGIHLNPEHVAILVRSVRDAEEEG